MKNELVTFNKNEVDYFIDIKIENDESNLLFITFNDAHDLGIKSNRFGSEYFEKRQLNVIHIVSSKPDFYKDLFDDNFLNLIRNYIAEKEVFIYGSSMGAIGTYILANRLENPAKIILLSPRFAIHSSVLDKINPASPVLSEDFYQPTPFLNNKKLYCYFSKNDHGDNVFKDFLDKYSPKVFWSGYKVHHPITRLLGENHILGLCIDRIVDDDFLYIDIESFDSPFIFYSNLKDIYLEGDYKKLLENIDIVLEKYIHDFDIHYLVLESFCRLNQNLELNNYLICIRDHFKNNINFENYIDNYFSLRFDFLLEQNYNDEARSILLNYFSLTFNKNISQKWHSRLSSIPFKNVDDFSSDGDNTLQDISKLFLNLYNSEDLQPSQIPRDIDKSFFRIYAKGNVFYITDKTISPMVNKKLVEHGVSPLFLSLFSQGSAAYAKTKMKMRAERSWDKNSSILSESLDPCYTRNLSQYDVSSDGISARMVDILDTIQDKSKGVICPFNFERKQLISCLGFDAYLLIANGNVCVVAQWTETDKCGDDSVWFFPSCGILLSFNYTWMTPIALSEKLYLLLSSIDNRFEEYKKYFSNTKRIVAIREPLAPHIGHYIWNSISCWRAILDYSPNGVDAFIYYKSWNIFGGVQELYPEICFDKKNIGISNEQDILDFMFSEGALVQTVKDTYVTQDLALRVEARSDNVVSQSFKSAVSEFKKNCYPIILITLRLGNRCWLDQKIGYISIINKLVEKFPNLGIVVDGMNGEFNTGWTHAYMSLEAERILAEEIISGCNNVNFFNSIGLTVAESISLGKICDFFVAPVGAGMAKYRWINNLPGVSFSHSKFLSPNSIDGHLYDVYRENAKQASYVSAEYVTDVPEPITGRNNFHVPWEVIYERVENLIESLNIK